MEYLFPKDGLELKRPVVIVISGMLLFNLPTLLYKIRLWSEVVAYFVVCNDKKWKKPKDPGAIFGPYLSSNSSEVERKTVFFVRHGESTWNDTFNKGSHRSKLQFALAFIPGLIKSILTENYLLLSGKVDSWFYDAPLSYLGIGQVEELAKFLETKKDSNSTLKKYSKEEEALISILRADPGAPASKIVCSNLRRALSTLVIGFRDRLRRKTKTSSTGDKILILPSLQEISRNPDTLSITPPHVPVQASWVEKSYEASSQNKDTTPVQQVLNTQVDMSLHTGNKPLDTNGLKRMLDFCENVHSPSIREQYIIAGGHSIWFREFFKTFLPYNVNHISKKSKIINAGVVAFDLIKINTKSSGAKYMIDPKSIKVVYGGFS